MSNEEIKRLGERIEQSDSISDSDLNKLQEYRLSFQAPIAEVFEYITYAAKKVDRNSIVTYRIKRIDSIIRKLKRFKNNPNGKMALSRMGDIAGCRCILSSDDNSKIYELIELIKNEYGDGCPINDHIAPAKSSGYRSVHIYVKDKTTNKPIEIQIRNRNHHNWATLVEIIDLIYDVNIKESNDVTSKLGRFLQLYAYKDELSEAKYKELFKCESKYRIFEHMSDTLTSNYLNAKRQWLRQRSNGSYFVIEADGERKTVIESFPSFQKAEESYFNRYVNNPLSNIVLTHLVNPSFEQISMAYSNYMLTMHAFIDEYRSLIEHRIISHIENRHYSKIKTGFKIYRRNIIVHIRNLKNEIKKIKECELSGDLSRSDANKWKRSINDRYVSWVKETRTFLNSLAKASHNSAFYQIVIRHQLQRITKDLNK